MTKNIDITEKVILSPMKSPENLEKKKHTFLIPVTVIILIMLVVIILYVLYINFLPFGFSQESSLLIGKNDDTLNEFKILPSGTWGNRATEQNGTSYRILQGAASVLYTPKLVLTDANVTMSVKGENAALYPPDILFNKDNATWQRSWDFTKQLPVSFVGNTYLFDNCTYFDGKSILTLKDSADQFETGPFSIYLEWLPMQDLDSQEVLGHFNWEIFQSKNYVTFQLGRTTDTDSPFYSIKAPIEPGFFNKKHTVIVQYKPDISDGYIEMFLDGKFIERKYIKNAKIDTEYGDKGLSLGWSSHNYQKNPYFKGCVYNVGFTNNLLISPKDSISFVSKTPSVEVPIVGDGKVYRVDIKVEKKQM